MILEDHVVRLRPLAPADADEWLAGEDEAIVQGFEFPRPSTRDDAVRAIERWSGSWRTGGTVRHWAICDRASGAVAGGVEIRKLEGGDVNLSYCVFAPWRRRGFATRACALALAFAVRSMGATRAIVKVLDWNEASLAVARRLGARPIGSEPSEAGGTFVVFHRDLVAR